MARLIKQGVRDVDLNYEPPLVVGFGINDKTCDNPKLTMGHTIVPPAGRNQAHYHANAPAGLYLSKGQLRLFLGPDDDKQEMIMDEGDFLYLEPGEIHGLINLSDTEEAEIIFTYSGVASKDIAGTVFVEPRWDE
jgi:quercetin dioxygenase-like cupin family protein